MQVFKAYFKVIKKNLPSISIYIVVFMAMAVMFLNLSGGSGSVAAFTATKTNIALFVEDDSPLVDGLTESLMEISNLVPLEDSTESIQDALFHEQVDYVLRVPAGFTDGFISGTDDVQLLKTARPLSPGSVSVDMLISKYLNLSRLYQQNMPNMTADQIADNVLRDLSISADVELKGNERQLKTAGITESFRYLAYPILAILMMGITSIMMAFSKAEISRRNMCAPLSPSKMSLQLFLGNAVFAVIVWVLLCAISIALYGKSGLNTSVLLLCLNALVFTVFCASVAFLVGKFIKSPVVQAAVTNVVSLGICFLSGVFMDQYLLGETVLKIASFSPGFWYIKAVNGIKELTSFSFENLRPVFEYMLIQLAFAAACIVIALVASKQKKQNMAR
jgi:ABC-2 type transport system permease protein